MRLISRLSLVLFVLAAPLGAQAQKRVLTQADWDKWRSIQSPTLSSDGKWVAYTLVPQVGDGELVIRSTSTPTEHRVQRGWLGRPNNSVPGARGAAPGGGGAGRGGGAGGAPQFAGSNRFVVTMTQPTQAETERAERAARSAPRGGGAGAGRGAAGGGAAAAAATRTSLVIVDVTTGEKTTVPNVRSFTVAGHTGKWLAYVPGTDTTARRDSAGRGGPPGAVAATPGGQPRPIADSTTRTPPRRTYGNPLVLRNMETGTEERMADVVSFTFDDSAKVMGFVVASRDTTKDGVFVRNMATGTVTPLMTGTANYRGFTLDRSATQVAFLSDKPEYGKDNARFTIYHATLRGGAATPVVTPAQLTDDMRVAEGGVSFTRAGTGLVFSVTPPPLDSIPADSLVGKAVFDLWHWKDPDLQPAQRLQGNRPRNYQSIYHLGTKKIVRLADDTITTVTLSDEGRVGVANTGVRYSVERMWGANGTDIYLVDGITGARKLIRENSTGSGQLSPDAKYLTIFENKGYTVRNIATGKEVVVTAPLAGVRFENESHDTPSTPGAYGIAGWTKGDRTMLVYDRFDVWELDPAGVRPPVMVTDSVGRRGQLRFRLVNLDRDDRFIDPAKPLLFRVFNEDTKASGFYRDRLGAVQAPEKVVMDDVNYGTPQKADDADVFMLTKSTFVEYPNLWVGPSLTQLAKISNANPQQAEYNWGTVELVRWYSSDGVPLKGLLYKPENFDPNKKYPMISYFYEQLSDGLHSYVAPTGRNVINATHYASNGYLIFQPDIYYEEGYPGPSAMKSIVPGVQMLLARGYVDPKGLGLQGQSWGGYQTAYMITQTTMFRAAMAGAPVANMTSAYGGIRWGSGLARAFQYETGQSRIGGSLWETPMRYIENSPLFWLDKVTTPLFIMHNDEDDAVPWYQGIELFVGLRRLQKEVYMINYNGDVHNPSSRANQKDVAMRMQQFFDHHLRGMPAPEWMIKGIPFRMKGRDQIATPAQPAIATPSAGAPTAAVPPGSPPPPPPHR